MPPHLIYLRIRRYSMANSEHVELLGKGVATWNQWREDRSDMRPDLRGADLRNAILAGVNLSAADLPATILTQADLRHADLRHA